MNREKGQKDQLNQRISLPISDIPPSDLPSPVIDDRDGRNPSRELSLYGSIPQDLRIARILQTVYMSELEDAVKYRYQHVLTDGIDSRASEVFDSISLDEYEHFRLVGILIRALGANPVPIARIRTPAIDFTDDVSCRAPLVVRRMVESDIKDEIQTAETFRAIKALVPKDYTEVRGILDGIISDETEHKRELGRLLLRE